MFGQRDYRSYAQVVSQTYAKNFIQSNSNIHDTVLHQNNDVTHKTTSVGTASMCAHVVNDRDKINNGWLYSKNTVMGKLDPVFCTADYVNISPESNKVLLLLVRI